MGGAVYVQFKTEKAAMPFDYELRGAKKAGGFRKEASVGHVNTKADNQAWLDDINNNPKSPQAHLKPADRDLTMRELRNMFEMWTVPGNMFFDVYFGRTNEDEMRLLFELMLPYADAITSISGSTAEWWDRAKGDDADRARWEPLRQRFA